MELICTLKGLCDKLPVFGFSEELEAALREYLQFLRKRDDLLQLAETYHNDIYENGRYTPAEVVRLPECDGREQGMLFAVIFLARYARMDEILALRGIDPKQKQTALDIFCTQINKNKAVTGKYGFNGYYRMATVNMLKPNRYTLGRLVFETATFDYPFEIYRRKSDGADLPMALPGFRYLPDGRQATRDYAGECFEPTLEVTDRQVTGYTFDGDGRLIFEPVTLSLAEYEKAVAKGDDAISIHIPGGGRMTPEAVADAIAQAKEFFAKHFADMDFKVYMCSSWLMDTAMREFLSPETNILKFQNIFRVVLTGVNTFSLHWHIFGIEQFVPLTELKPANDFQRTFLDRAKDGKTMYSGLGYFFL